MLDVNPPRRQLVWSRETGLDRAADNHYPTMTRDALAALELPAAKDCVFLWTTVVQLENAMRLIEQWGFEYKSAHGWAKPDLGTGYRVRENLELLLIATRGTVLAPTPERAVPVHDRGATRRAQRETGPLRRDDRAALFERAQARNVRP